MIHPTWFEQGRRRGRRDRQASVGLIVMVVALVVGCGMALPTPSPSPSSQALAATPPPALSDLEIAEAVHFRESFGLRSDVLWVRHVAADPASVTDYGPPLTVEEAAQVGKQMATARALLTIVDGYARKQPEYAGSSTDQQRGVVVVRFSGRLEVHRAAIAKLVPVGAAVEVVEVRYTRAELEALVKRIGGDLDWLATIKAAFDSAGVDPVRNLVFLRISSANPDAPSVIVEHYAGQGKMYVESDGTGVRMWKTGTLVVQGVDRLGRPVPHLLVVYTGDVPGTGSGDVGVTTNARGEIQLVVAAPVTYTVQLMDGGSVRGAGRAAVRVGERRVLRIVLK